MTSNELTKWADDFMFEAEPSKASEGVTAYLLGGPVDPLGQIAACAKMYKGEVVRDLRDVTDAERADMLKQIQATTLKMPLESVSLHFMVEGVHRGITHQMVRQRTAAFAQESTRFAVKRDMREATALPPSLVGTHSLDEEIENQRTERRRSGLKFYEGEEQFIRDELLAGNGGISKEQHARILWDQAVQTVSETYNRLVDSGMAAEDARGLMPTNITTRLNYITNLRSFYEYMSVRVGDQAQFEWRQVVAAYVVAMRKYGAANEYEVWVTDAELRTMDTVDVQQLTFNSFVIRRDSERERTLYRRSSAWQYEALVNEIKPKDFELGRRAFGASFDRPSRIGERVDAFAAKGIPSSQWTEGSVKHSIPPIHPKEWLSDPNAARLDGTQEFDIFGNRVERGAGWHWVNEGNGVLELAKEGYYLRAILSPKDPAGDLEVIFDSREAEAGR